MKTLKNNKLLAWMLALITAVCAFLGVMLTTPLSTALADDTAQQITNETFPDTSTWEEKTVGEIKTNDADYVKNNISGKMFRVYIKEGGANFIEMVSVIDGNAELMLSYDNGNLNTNTSQTGTVAYKVYDNYIEFIWYAPDGAMIEYWSIQGDEDISVYLKLIEEPAAETPSETPDETPDVEDEGKWSDKTADWLNENLGLTLTGSVVSVVVVVLVVYFLFFRKRR